jgi:hypothetical protein
MDGGMLAQYTAITIAVLLSIAFVAKKQFPAGVRRLRIVCAVPLVRAGRHPRLQRIGRWLAPAPVANAGDCGGCTSCDTAK